MYAELIRELTYTDSFFDSLNTIRSNFSANTVIMCLMMVFTVIGGIDKIRGNRKGYGEKFDEAFAALGSVGAKYEVELTAGPGDLLYARRL